MNWKWFDSMKSTQSINSLKLIQWSYVGGGGGFYDALVNCNQN